MTSPQPVSTHPTGAGSKPVDWSNLDSQQSFLDRKGQRWLVDINVATLRRVKRLTQVDFLSGVDGDTFVRMAEDLNLLTSVLEAACLPQIESNQMTSEQFAEILAGDVLESATEALMKAIVGFSRRPDLRRALGALLEKHSQVLKVGADRVMARIEEIDPVAVVKTAEAQVAQTAGHSSTSLPESSGSAQKG